MTASTLSLEAPAATIPPERRTTPRESIICDLWMIDHAGATVLRCRCDDVSPDGMRLRVPVGYGVAEGQRYELRSSMAPAADEPPGPIVAARWATIVRTQLHVDTGQDFVEVGVSLDPPRSASRRIVH